MIQNPKLDEFLLRAAHDFGTPSFVYFASDIQERAQQLRDGFENAFQLSYAVKSNPNPSLLSWMKDHIDLLDVSSIGECRLALKAGWDASKLSFTGPGKRQFELEEAISNGIGELVIESVGEAIAADKIAKSKNCVQNVLIRIAPTHVPRGFGDQMAGRPVAFGVDFEDIDRDIPQIIALENLRVIGLHIYSGTQCLQADKICENYRNFISIFREISEKYNLSPEKLVFGSGLGIPYHNGDVALDLGAVTDDILGDLRDLKQNPAFEGTELILELGRYLVGQAGYFVTRVVSVKESRGTRIGICDGGMNNHLPASGHFGMVIHRNYPMHKVGDHTEASEQVNLVGPLCTSIDRLAQGVSLPHISEGDYIAVHNSGAYGITASPVHFISHSAPKEVFVDGDVMTDVSWIESHF